jgi:hypothetical protein
MSQKFIVAEITKNWEHGADLSMPILSQKFEQVINVNEERGYSLYSWRFNQVETTAESGGKVITETIIAVFVEKAAERRTRPIWKDLAEAHEEDV